MSTDLASVLTAARSLTAAERRELIDLLSADLDDALPEGAEIRQSDAWRAEIARRSAEYDAGRAHTVS